MSILWFASTNDAKINEMKVMLAPYGFTVKSLLDLPTPFDIAETGTSFVENALLKANTLAQLVAEPVIADDSGLEISGLDDFPGIYSARWKGTMSYHEAMLDILEQMQDMTNRQARFVCALAYVDKTRAVTKTFIGKLDGEITYAIRGDYGFGYDQIFYVPTYEATLGELALETKNQISHRYFAIKQLLQFLHLNENTN